MRSLKITLAYDGTEFAGWQIQPARRTVQQQLERALSQVAGHPVKSVASGRTDAGVHALGQVVSCETSSRHSPAVLQRALEGTTPRDMAIRDVEEAPAGFHAIRDCIGKRYRYVIDNSPVADVFSRRYAWHIPRPLDLDAMRRAAGPLIGRHDFAAFEGSGSRRKSSRRDVRDISLEDRPGEWGRRIVLEIEADGFLYNMVRNIVGTLVEVGRGARPADSPAAILAAGDRRLAGPTAPPQGLFLVAARYGG